MKSVVVLIPVFNDWEAFARLLAELDGPLATACDEARVLAIDDGSTAPPGAVAPAAAQWRAIASIDILPLRRNLGHQRAIALGLAHVEETMMPCDAVVVMDADGQDRPADVPRLIDRARQSGGAAVVFARRQRRSESLLFRFGYRSYQLLSRLTTGQAANVGNFSVVPGRLMGGLVTVSELWNHYAAAVHSARIPCEYVGTERGPRYMGRSTMNVQNLVAHGMSAMSVFGTVVGARLLGLQLALVLVAAALCLVTAAEGMVGTAIVVLALFLQGAIALFALVILISGNRDKLTFVPTRDYRHFVGAVRRVYPDG